MTELNTQVRLDLAKDLEMLEQFSEKLHLYEEHTGTKVAWDDVKDFEWSQGMKEYLTIRGNL